jgi:hypothetical protein
MGVAEAGSMLVVTQDSLVFEDRENRSERESPGGHPGLSHQAAVLSGSCCGFLCSGFLYSGFLS